MPVSLGELATQFACELVGDPDICVDSLASLVDANETALTFLASSTYLEQLPQTRAAAVVLRSTDAEHCPVAAFVCDNPYAMYARMAAVVCPPAPLTPGTHASACVATSAEVDTSAEIAANVVVGRNSRVGAGVYLGPGTVVGENCTIGQQSRLVANVTLVRDVTVGRRTTLHPGVVAGADGFGNAATDDGWVKVPQVGGVRIGDDVEIGANTTIDCGTLDDTVIGNGVRIDNLCMIAHNVQIGDHTALAGMTGIAGSTKIGKRCLFAGKSATVGHITVCDDVIVAAQTYLSKDVKTPGTYAASFPADDAKSWARQLARFRRLGALADRVKKLEK